MKKPASSLLALLKYRDGESDMKPIIGNGNILWSGHDGFEWIGKGGGEWDSVFLIKYKEFSEYQGAVERFGNGGFEQIKLFEVKTSFR